MNGDVLTDLNFADFHAEHAQENRLFTVSSYQREQKVDYGVLMTDPQGTLRGFRKNRSPATWSAWASTWSAGTFCLYVPRQGPYGFDELMRDLLEAQQTVHVRRFSGYWLDIGRADDYLQAIEEFSSMNQRFLNE